MAQDQLNENKVEFFWDPVCPWAWLTSRWVEEVAGQRGLEVDWRFICLKILNADKEGEGVIKDSHRVGLKLLRVAAAIRSEEGPSRMGELYTRFGGDIHVRGLRPQLEEQVEIGFPDYLRSAGVEEKYLGAANDESIDDLLRSEKNEALSRAGEDVGTPIITFFAGQQPTSFFGPVISRVPRGEEALELWDAVWKLAAFPGLAELKRSLRERPQLAESLG